MTRVCLSKKNERVDRGDYDNGVRCICGTGLLEKSLGVLIIVAPTVHHCKGVVYEYVKILRLLMAEVGTWVSVLSFSGQQGRVHLVQA